ncbi:MAG: divalent-cation tolerance protein CutA [Saprospirales bacterium]|nr:MAG: divalent-cation tolerance protein CutA [Saprospirales bacterium]
MKNNDVLIFYVTFADEKSALDTGSQLVEAGHAACVNVMPIKSCFIWEGRFEKEGEFTALFKTLPELEDRFRAEMEKIHPYDVPCILSWTVRANAAYRGWVESNIKL